MFDKLKQLFERNSYKRAKLRFFHNATSIFSILWLALMATGFFIWAAVPSDPTLSVPSSGATDIPINPTFTASTYSGSPAHQDTDWQIVETNDCAAGTIVWSSLADTTNLESINVNSLEGTFANTLSGYDALSYNTTYYACVRYRNADGTTAWVSNSFTTEDLADWSSNETIGITETSGSTLTSYQVRLQFSSSSIDFSNAESDGADLRFTDSTSTYGLPYYISDWDDTGETGVVWVRVPSLTASSSTEIKVYYNDTPDQSIPTTAGDAVFLDFTDENNFEDWTNGYTSSAYNTFAANGDWLHVEDNTGSAHRDAGKTSLSAAIQAETDFTLETRMKTENVASVSDNVILQVYDGNSNNRFSQLWIPYHTAQTKFGYYEGGTNKAFAAANFTFGTTYEISQVVDGASNQVDYLIYDTSRTLIDSQVNEGLGKGSPTSADILRIATGGSSTGMKTDAYFDFIAFREYSTSEPTYNFGTLSVLQAIASDGDADDQIDNIEVTFDRDIDAATLASSDFSLSDSYTIASVNETSAGVVDITLNESGSNDMSTSLTLTIASQIDATDGTSLSSGDTTVISATCPTGSISNGAITVSTATTWTADSDDIWNCSGVDLSVNDTLTLEGDTTNGYWIRATFDNITVASGASITADEEGCRGTLSGYGDGPDEDGICTTGSATTFGGAGSASTPSSGGGGSYGGGGGDGLTGNGITGGISYGSKSYPTQPGSAGGSTSGQRAGYSGGVIHLTTNDTFTLNGTLTANGADGVYDTGNARAGGSAGGSIYVNTDVFAGSGCSITATGGDSYSGDEDSGAAGGGRVALHYNSTTGCVSGLSASTVVAGGTAADSNVESGEEGSFELNPSLTPGIVQAYANDNDSNSQIDQVILKMDQDIDAATIATSDFSISGKTISAASRTDYAEITLTINESGSADMGTELTPSISGSITGISGTVATSGSKAATPASCPDLDGTAADGDKTINGTFRYESDQTVTATDSDGFNCVGQDLLYTEDVTVTIEGDTTNGYYYSMTADNITIDAGSTLSADEKGCGYDASGGGHGSGPDGSNICDPSSAGGGDGETNGNNLGAAGAGHGGAGSDAVPVSYIGGLSYGSSASPSTFGSSGGHAGTSGGYHGGKGGGVIHLTAESTFDLNGTITADGGAGQTGDGNHYSGGGSGGSIMITANTLESSSNDCLIAATGGNAGGDGTQIAGAGAGGRVSLNPTTVDAGMTCYSSMSAAVATAKGTSSQSSTYDGEDGTLFKAGDSSDPTVDTITAASSSGGSETSLNLTDNSTTTVYVHGTITDADGCEDVETNGTVSGVFYRTNHASGDSCTADNNDCYALSSGNCTLTGCTGGGDDTFNYECTADIQYYADPTDTGSTHAASDWTAKITAEDASAATANNTDTIEMNSLTAVTVPASVNYGTVSHDAESAEQSITVTNSGNRAIDLNLSSEDLSCDGAGSDNLDASAIRFSETSSFTYASGTALSNTPTEYELNLAARTDDGSASTSTLYIKIKLPESGLRGSCSGNLTVDAKIDD